MAHNLLDQLEVSLSLAQPHTERMSKLMSCEVRDLRRPSVQLIVLQDPVDSFVDVVRDPRLSGSVDEHVLASRMTDLLLQKS